jgi:hypothetical protein
MTEATLSTQPQRQAPPQPLVCRLRHTSGSDRNGAAACLAEIELQNVSAVPLEIAYRMTVLQYLNLIVTRADGQVISQGHFGDRFAPTFEPRRLRLEPGATFTATVHLFATVTCDRPPPGRYTIQAVYEYDGFRAVSNPVQLAV